MKKRFSIILTILLFLSALAGFSSAQIQQVFQGEEPVVGEYVNVGGDSEPEPGYNNGTYTAKLILTQDGEPLKYTYIYLYVNMNQWAGFYGYTDKNGQFIASNVPAGANYRWMVYTYGYHYSDTFTLGPDNTYEWDFPAADQTASITVTLDGTPLKYTPVYLYQNSTNNYGYFDYTGVYGYTLEDGKYSSSNIMPGDGYLWMVYYGNTYFYSDQFSLPPENHQTLALSDKRYYVKVNATASGSPLANQYVYLYRNTNQYGGIWGYTDSQGLFESDDVMGGKDFRWALYYQGYHYSDLFDLPPNTTTNLALGVNNNTATIRLTSGGKPLKDQYVYLYKDPVIYPGYQYIYGSYVTGGRTDSNGQFSKTGLFPDDDYFWSVYLYGSYNYSETFSLPPDNLYELDLPNATNKATIKLILDDAPLSGAYTYLYKDDSYMGYGYTDSQGTYTLENLPEDDNYEWMVYYNGYHNSETFSLPPDNTQIINLSGPKYTAKIKLVKDSTPLSNVYVYLIRDQYYWAGSSGYTNSLGEFTSDEVLPGSDFRWAVYYQGYQYTPFFDMPPDNTQTMNFSDGYNVKITVTKGGTPLSGAYTYLYKDYNQWSGVYGSTNSNGEFSSSSVPNGTDYRWYIYYQGMYNYTDPFDIPPESDIHFDFPSGTNKAKIKVTSAGTPLKDAYVTLYRDFDKYTGYGGYTNSNGEYQATGLIDGNYYRWRVGYQGQYNYTDPFNMPPDSTVSFNYPSKSNKATVKVMRNGSPIANQYVYLYSNYNQWTGNYGYTNSNGEFVASNLFDGSNYRWYTYCSSTSKYSDTFDLPPDDYTIINC